MCHVTLIRGSLSFKAQHLILLLRQVISSEAGYDFQLFSISASLSCLQLFFECHILSFHQVAQQVHSFPTSCSLPPSFFPWLYHAVMIHVLVNAQTTRLHFPTVSNILLVSLTLHRTFSLLILTHIVK